MTAIRRQPEPSRRPQPSRKPGPQNGRACGRLRPSADDAEAIRAAAANFPACIEHLWPLARAAIISRGVSRPIAGSAEPDLRIMDLLDNQPEFTKSVWDYLDILVTDERIRKGRELLEKFRATFEAVEALTAWNVHRRRDLGRRDRLRRHRRRSLGLALRPATLACIGRRRIISAT